MTILSEISRNLLKISGGDVATLSAATTDFARSVTQLISMPKEHLLETKQEPETQDAIKQKTLLAK